MSKPNKYKARGYNSDKWFEGYYFEYPDTTYCFDTDPKPEIIHGLVFHTTTDWGLPNDVKFVRIDVNTLEEIYEN